MVVWNCNGLSDDKRDNEEFCEIISRYDLIFLLESWTDKDRNVEVEGYLQLTFTGSSVTRTLDVTAVGSCFTVEKICGLAYI